jgi:hypothetical protein
MFAVEMQRRIYMEEELIKYILEDASLADLRLMIQIVKELISKRG